MQGSNVTSCPPQMIMKQMEAGAFRELCQHLRERSDEVQNIDLMTLSGFCRNCLAKVSHFKPRTQLLTGMSSKTSVLSVDGS